MKLSKECISKIEKMNTEELKVVLEYLKLITEGESISPEAYLQSIGFRA